MKHRLKDMMKIGMRLMCKIRRDKSLLECTPFRQLKAQLVKDGVASLGSSAFEKQHEILQFKSENSHYCGDVISHCPFTGFELPTQESAK